MISSFGHPTAPEVKPCEIRAFVQLTLKAASRMTATTGSVSAPRLRSICPEQVVAHVAAKAASVLISIDFPL
jgi:hypothetical protein